MSVVLMLLLPLLMLMLEQVTCSLSNEHTLKPKNKREKLLIDG